MLVIRRLSGVASLQLFGDSTLHVSLRGMRRIIGADGDEYAEGLGASWAALVCSVRHVSKRLFNVL